MKILLTCSAGGHLSEVRQLRSFYKEFDYFFVTFKRPDTESLAEKERVYFIPRPGRNIWETLKCFWQAKKILEKEKPKLVISFGADVTVPVCLIARWKKIPVVFVESFCRIQTPSWTGKILRNVSNYVLYQWEELKKFYPNGIFAGSIFANKERYE
jgi:UDP-N-acetylglucosamine:LPS N-acetylglucosamine transferase